MLADLFSTPDARAICPLNIGAKATPGAPLQRKPHCEGSTTLLRRPVCALLAMLVAVLTVYAPSLSGQFLWDDNSLVLHNLLIRSPVFSGEIFRHTLFNGESNFYRPTQTLTFIADYWLWSLDPFGYHLTSILIHTANGFLLFLVLRRVLPVLLKTQVWTIVQTEAMAFAVALLWALHPVHSAAVAYISGSADSLAMLFCLSAWLCCARALAAAGHARRLGWSVGAFAALLLGLCSKEIAFVWLMIFAGCLFGLQQSEITRRAKWMVVAGSMLALLCYLGLRHLPPAPPTPPPPVAMPAKGLLMLRALGDYGRLMLFPDKLFMERQVFAAPGLAHPADESVYRALAAGGVLMLAAFVGGAFWRGRGRDLRRFGAGWFLLGFLPVSNLFSLNASVAEHWLYLPSIGFLLFLAGVMLDLPFPAISLRRAAPWATAAVVLVAGMLGARTWYRAFDWQDELTFFRQTISDGGDVPRARAGLAVAYSHQHDDAHAVGVLREVVANYPNVLSARINLANALDRQGQSGEARAILKQAAADLFARGGDPREVVTTIHSLDRLELDNPGWPRRRKALLLDAMRRHADSWELVQVGVLDSENAHAPAESLALIQSYIGTHWWHAPAWYAAGCVEAELGRSADALAAWTRAARYDVHDADAPDAAAMLCLQQGRIDEARAFQQSAVRRQPDSPKQHALLARVLERRGDLAEAATQSAIATRLVEQVEPQTTK